MGDGTNTKEYQQFCSKISLLTDIIIDALPDVAKELHQAVLISAGNKRRAENQFVDATIRASELTQLLLNLIKVDKDKFYEISTIFKSMEALLPKRTTIFNIFHGEIEEARRQGEGGQEETDDGGRPDYYS